MGELGLQGFDGLGEPPDALVQLFRCHGVGLQHRPERHLIEVDLLLGGLGIKGVELALQFPLGLAQLVKQAWGDGEQIASRQLDDFVGVAETRPHHLGFVAVGLEVVEDLAHGKHAGIFWAWITRSAGTFLEPVQNSPHEGGNQGDPCFRTGHRLGKAKEQGEVAMDALALQFFSGLDAFPGGSDFDQHPIGANPGHPIQTNQLAGLGDGGFGVVTEACIHLG